MYESVEKILDEGIDKKIFSGAGVGIYSSKKDTVIEVYRGSLNEDGYEAVTGDTFFDLASLTKAMVTSLLIMGFVKKELPLHTTLLSIYGSEIGIDPQTTIADLLLHQSGFPDHRKFYERCTINCQEQIISEILQESAVYKRGEKQIYSDLGFILLGDIIERISGETLPLLWRKRVAIPLGIEDEFLFSSDRKLINKSCAHTTSIVDNFVDYCGQVHDDNCRVLGGSAGHAGLFGTIKGSLKLYISLLNTVLGRGDFPFIDRESLLLFWKKPSNSRWAYGFDTPSALFSTAGDHFSNKTVGHLGFTGTSFWIDPEEELVVSLFTNRALYPESLRDMKVFRPRIHNLIMKEILHKK